MVLSLLLAALVSGCAASEFIAYKGKPDYPRDEDETLRLPGLEDRVTIMFDAAGVPHISASSEIDLVRAVGFVHGRNRFFHMDLLRRLATGRVCELVGEQPFLDGTTVEFDLTMRGWDMDRSSRRDVEEQDPETRLLLDAYSDGVNAAMNRFEPLEYRLLRIQPEPWSPSDTYAIGRLIAFSVTHNWHQEASRLLLALHVGARRSETIYGAEPMPDGRSLDPGGIRRQLPPSVVHEIEALFPAREYVPPEDGGATALTRLPGTFSGASNAWVVGPDRSKSGMPILANDPHMTHMLPSLMFQQHLHAGPINAIGITVPGIPYIVSGHNDRVAWGMTSAVGDTVDLCVEWVNPVDSGLVKGPGGRWEPIEVDRVVIRIKDRSDITDRHFTIRRTRNGPAFNDMYPNLMPKWAPLITMRWDASGVSGSMPALSDAQSAGDVGELRQALQRVTTPINTWTAADVDGNVALFATGRVPIRHNHRGTFPVPGWLGKYDWSGDIRNEDLPHASASGDTVFIHGNNLMIDPATVNFPIQVDSGPSYRYDRISELLARTDKHDRKSLATIQGDVYLGRAARLVKHIVHDLHDAPDLDPVDIEARELLERWDFIADADSAATAIFFMTYREATMAALVDELDEAGFAFIMAQRYSTNAADEWLVDPDHPVWDHRGTPGIEKRTAVVRVAFKRAVDKLSAEHGSRPSQWRWGRMHDLVVTHPFGGMKILAEFLNLPRFEASGGLDSVWKSHFDLGHPEHPFRAMAGPVSRIVVDLADIHHGQWILDSGESGWPGSPHYGDQQEMWKKGEYMPMISDWSEIAATAVGTWTLEPGGTEE